MIEDHGPDTSDWEDELEKELAKDAPDEEKVFNIFTKNKIDIEKKIEFIKKNRTANALLDAVSQAYPSDLVIISLYEHDGFTLTSTIQDVNVVNYLLDRAKKRVVELNP